MHLHALRRGLVCIGSPRAAVGLESAGVVTGLDLEMGSLVVGLGLGCRLFC